MKKKLFLVFLAVSLLPTALMTILSSVAIYRQVYQATITLNSEGLQWSQEQLRYYSSEISGMFYSLELDRDFKQAVERWDGGADSLQDFGLVRERLLSLLNRYSFMSSLQLLVPGSDISILAERTGVRIMGEGDETFRNAAVITRNQDLQTNLFFKRRPGGVVAVHDMRRFDDQSLIAQIQAGIHLRPLESIMSRLLLLNQEQIVIQNDEDEVIASLPGHNGLAGGKADGFANGDQWVRFSSYAPRERLSISKAVPRREIARSILPAVYGGLLIGILSAMGAIAASALLSSIMSKPVARLAERVRNIELQTLVLAGEDESGDEVSLLEHHITLFVQRIRQLIRDEYDSKMQARLAQIDALQAQINPHFLHNTLQLIGSLSLAGRSQEAYRMTTALGSLMRYSMGFDDSFVTLDDELRNLEHYFTIQRERFTDRFSVDMHVDPQVKDCLVPKLLVQPLVENAFSHGFTGSRRWQLDITAFQDEAGKVHVVVRDNGAGIEEELLKRLQEQIDQRNREGSFLGPLRLAEHIGLLNTNDRIRLSYAPGDGLTLSSKAGEFTEVSLCFEARRHA
jgi:two-component system sensor histidine kinase YesM